MSTMRVYPVQPTWPVKNTGAPMAANATRAASAGHAHEADSQLLDRG